MLNQAVNMTLGSSSPDGKEFLLFAYFVFYPEKEISNVKFCLHKLDNR